MRESVADDTGSIAGADLGHQIAAVGVDGEGADEERAGDFFARPPIGDESENLFFAGADVGRVARAGVEPARDFREQTAAAGAKVVFPG